MGITNRDEDIFINPEEANGFLKSQKDKFYFNQQEYNFEETVGNFLQERGSLLQEQIIEKVGQIITGKLVVWMLINLLGYLCKKLLWKLLVYLCNKLIRALILAASGDEDDSDEEINDDAAVILRIVDTPKEHVIVQIEEKSKTKPFDKVRGGVKLKLTKSKKPDIKSKFEDVVMIDNSSLPSAERKSKNGRLGQSGSSSKPLLKSKHQTVHKTLLNQAEEFTAENEALTMDI